MKRSKKAPIVYILCIFLLSLTFVGCTNGLSFVNPIDDFVTENHFSFLGTDCAVTEFPELCNLLNLAEDDFIALGDDAYETDISERYEEITEPTKLYVTLDNNIVRSVTVSIHVDTTERLFELWNKLKKQIPSLPAFDEQAAKLATVDARDFSVNNEAVLDISSVEKYVDYTGESSVILQTNYTIDGDVLADCFKAGIKINRTDLPSINNDIDYELNELTPDVINGGEIIFSIEQPLVK